jgi:hypothetical protein
MISQANIHVLNSQQALRHQMSPPVLCGRNLGANFVEQLLVALPGCLTTNLVAHAAARGTAIKKVATRDKGDLDLRGFLGIAEEVPVGYRNVLVYFKHRWKEMNNGRQRQKG